MHVEMMLRRGSGRDTRPCGAQVVARQLDKPRGGGGWHAPKNERLARNEGATTTPVTSKWLDASGAPVEARRSSSALGHEPLDASPAAAAAARAGARLRATGMCVSATRACGAAAKERTAKRLSGEGGAARSRGLVLPPAATRRRAWRQAGREARAAVPSKSRGREARVRVVRPKLMAASYIEQTLNGQNGALSKRFISRV